MPRLKTLTIGDLAQRLFDDQKLKEQLVDVVLDLIVERTGEDEEELRSNLLSRMESTLVDIQNEHAMRRLQVTCLKCELDIVFGVRRGEEDNHGLNMTCCECGNTGTFKIPKSEEALAVCQQCGNKTKVKEIKEP